MGQKPPGEAPEAQDQSGSGDRKGHRSHAPRPGGGPRPPPAYLTGPGSPSIQLTTWNFSRSQKRMVLQRKPGLMLVSTCRPVAGKTRFSADTCPPTPGQGLLSMLEVDTGLGSRHPSKAQDAGARKLESGEEMWPGSQAGLVGSQFSLGRMTPQDKSQIGQKHTERREVWRVTGHRPCSSSSPVRAARSQEVLWLGWNSTTLDRPRRGRGTRHHLASSQIPELGQGGLEVRTSLASASGPPSQPVRTLIQEPLHSGQSWAGKPDGEGGEDPTWV